MKYCKYHPLEPATYYCEHCDIATCDDCVEVDQARRRIYKRCHSCGKEVTSLGATYNAEPFWRRLQESFRYPLAKECLVLIIGVSALTVLLSFVRFGFVGIIFLTGAITRYAFACLENSAAGELEAPDINEAYQGGLSLLLQLIIIFAFFVALVFGAAYIFGMGAASFVGLLCVIALPAIIINFAISNDLFSAINPLKSIGLITTIGLPYGLLLAFIMIMSASVGVLQQLIGYQYSLLSMILQSVISNYYMIVLFHIMGYMIFQYQGKLGFTARANESSEFEEQSELEQFKAKIGVMVKEGEFEKAVELFSEAVKKYPRDEELLNNCFDFLYASKNAEDIAIFAPRYLEFIIRKKRQDKLNLAYKKILQVAPDFKPTSANVRFHLAKECKRAGDPGSAVKLLNGLHKQEPEYPYIVEAYELLAEALEDIPNMRSKVAACRKLVEQLKRIRPKPETKPATDKASFEAQEVKSGFSKQEQDTMTSASPEESPEDSSEETPEEEKSRDLPPIEFK